MLQLIIKISQVKQQNKTDSWFGELRMDTPPPTSLLAQRPRSMLTG